MVHEKHPADVTHTMTPSKKTNRWPLINFIDAELIWTDDRGQSRPRAYPARASAGAQMVVDLATLSTLVIADK